MMQFLQDSASQHVAWPLAESARELLAGSRQVEQPTTMMSSEASWKLGTVISANRWPGRQWEPRATNGHVLILWRSPPHSSGEVYVRLQAQRPREQL